MGNSIVHFQPFKRGRFFRIEPEFLDLFAEELLFFRMIVKAACLDLISPTFDFLRRFLCACLVEPFDYFLVACALLNLRFEIVTLYVLEAKEHVIQRTIEVIVADIPRHERATFIDGAAKNRIAANANARTSRRLFL